MSHKELSEIKKYLAEQISRMQDSSGKTMSRLFYDFKVTVTKDLALLQEQNMEMLKHAAETRAEVKKNAQDLAELKVKVKKDIDKSFKNAMKVVAISFLVTSFLWIKESRDFIIAIINRII